MTLSNALAFAPEWWLLLGALIAFALGRTRRPREDAATITGLIAVVLAAATLLTQLRGTLTIYHGTFVLDGYARVLQGIILLSAAATLVLTLADRTWTPAPDFTGFLLVGTGAALLIAGGADLVSLAIELTLLGLCLAVMVVAGRPAAAAAAAGESAFSTVTLAGALVAYGLAVFYGISGQTALASVGLGLVQHLPPRPALAIALALVVTGAGILVGMVPVQWGLQAIFQRAPLPVNAFLGSVVVTAVLGALARLLGATLATSTTASVILATLAAATMTGGNLIALGERSLRRLIAAALIGQAGYAIAALVALRQGGAATLLVIAASMATSVIAALAAVVAYVQRVHSDRVADLDGMATYAPGAATVLALALLSMAGLPPLAGFFGKLLVLQAVLSHGYVWLAFVGLVNLVVAALIAARVVRAVFLDPPVFEVGAIRTHPAQSVALGAGALGVIAFGAILGPLLGFATFGARGILP